MQIVGDQRTDQAREGIELARISSLILQLLKGSGSLPGALTSSRSIFGALLPPRLEPRKIRLFCTAPLVSLPRLLSADLLLDAQRRRTLLALHLELFLLLLEPSAALLEYLPLLPPLLPHAHML